MTDCLFCKIAAKEFPSTVVYEDDAVIAVMDIKPVNPGHVLVIPKRHSVDLLDVDPETLAKTSVAVQRVARAVKQATHAEGINLAQNSGAVAGQVIMHLHFHVIPRHTGDGRELWHGEAYGSQEEMEAVAERIKEHL